MRIHQQDAFVIVDLDFVAAVPAGHEVAVLQLEQPRAGFFDDDAAECVLDRTAQILYADHVYWRLLLEALVLAVPAEDPVAALGSGWRVKGSVEGRALGAVVSTRDGGDANHARTRLHLAALVPDRPYR